MAHFAQLDENSVVLQVIVVHNNDCLDGNGNESEAVGVAFCQSLLGGVWKQTSYNSNMRKNYAGLGYVYDSERDAFYAPSPFPSWTLDEETCYWNPPTAMPVEEGKMFQWNEETLAWVEFIPPVITEPTPE
jgi:hypothetical protein